MKKIIALLLAAVLIVGLVGCGRQKRQIVRLTLSTEDSEAILAAAGIRLPDVEDAPAAGSIIKFYGWGDTIHNYSEDEIVNTGYWTFREKYGCEVEWVECTWSDRFTRLATLVLGGTSPDFYDAYAESFPKYYFSGGIFAPVDDYIDYDDPLWSGVKEFAEKFFSIGNHYYMFITDASFNNVCAYNRRVINEYGFDDPAELFYNNDWTWDKFYDMCLAFSDPDEDRFALDGWGVSPAFMASCGTLPVTLDPDTGRFVSNLDDPRLERAAGYLYDLNKNECVYPIWGRGGPRGEDGAGINEGLCLFWLRMSWAFTGPVSEKAPIWGDIENGELMFCPIPRDEHGDGNYYVDTAPTGFSLIKDAPNPEGVALYAACCRFKTIDPAVIAVDERQLKEVYCWSDEMVEMKNTIYKLAKTYNTVIDYEGGIGDLSGYVSNMIYISNQREPSTWAQLKEANSDAISYHVERLNKEIDDFIDS